MTVPNMAEDIDAYLREAESAYPDIRPECEKKVLWHNDIVVRTRFSIVYLHGFSASRRELSPVCELLGKKLEANVFFTRLAGHGCEPSALHEAGLQDWQHDAVEALKVGTVIGEQVIVIGNSTGAALATWLALRDVQAVYAYVLISPNFGLQSRLATMYSTPLVGWLVPILLGNTRKIKVMNEEHKNFWTTTYPLTALAPVLELTKTVQRADTRTIRHPVCVLMCEKDKVIDTTQVKSFYVGLRTVYKRMVIISDTHDPQNHVLAGAVFAPENTNLVAGEIHRFLSEELSFL